MQLCAIVHNSSSQNLVGCPAHLLPINMISIQYTGRARISERTLKPANKICKKYKWINGLYPSMCGKCIEHRGKGTEGTEVIQF